MYQKKLFRKLKLYVPKLILFPRLAVSVCLLENILIQLPFGRMKTVTNGRIKLGISLATPAVPFIQS